MLRFESGPARARLSNLTTLRHRVLVLRAYRVLYITAKVVEFLLLTVLFGWASEGSEVRGVVLRRPDASPLFSAKTV